MFERIFEIILFVIAELKYDSDLTKVDVKKLEKLGYSSSEISTAFSWLVDKMTYDEVNSIPNESIKEKSLRVFDESEKEIFTKEALGELTQLNTLGLINSIEIEYLIERVLISGSPEVDKKMLSDMLGSILFNNMDSGYYGSRLILTGNETIN